jgi:hypothetical protein
LLSRVQGIDHGGDMGGPEDLAQLRIPYEGGDHRAGRGKARGFDQHALERRQLAALAALVQPPQRLLEFAADGAADAAVVQQHRVGVDAAYQQMVQPHGAEFVDQHGGLGSGRVLQPLPEQRGLAAAQRAREHTHGQACIAGHGACSGCGQGMASRSSSRASSRSAAGHNAPKSGTRTLAPVGPCSR